MSSMWRVAGLSRCFWPRRLQLGPICWRPPPIRRAAASLRAERRLLARPMAEASAISGYSFADYAWFLIANPGLAGRIADAPLGGEERCSPGENAGDGPRLFRRRQAEKRQRLGPAGRGLCSDRARRQALDAARRRGARPISARPTSRRSGRGTARSFTRADHDRRVDSPAVRQEAGRRRTLHLASASPERQAAFAARIAMQQDRPTRTVRYAAVIGSVTSDAGLMMDRAR